MQEFPTFAAQTRSMGFWGLVRTIFVILIVYQVINYFRRSQENAKRRGFEEGRRNSARQDAPPAKPTKPSDDELGEYVDYEEIKD
jgi:flagellar biosynthesis/type III secretory pathway M-ring protein FliF/YscJ